MVARTMVPGLVMLLAAGCISIKGNVVDADTAQAEENVFRHVVLFKYKDTATPENIKAVEDAFLDLKNKIDVIKDIETGSNVSTENLSHGFTDCFIVTFADSAGRDAYLPSPEHQAFVKFAGPFLAEALVIDFKPRK